MSTFVASFEEYEWLDRPNIVEANQKEDENFPILPEKWPVDTFINVDSLEDDKKLGMLLIQKQLLEESGEKDASILNIIADLNTNIECLKSKDVIESKKIKIENVIPSKQTINTDLTRIKKQIEKNHEMYDEKLRALTTKKKYLRDHLKLLNLSIDDMKYELHKKIQCNDINYIDQIKRLEGLQRDLVNTAVKDESLTQLLIPINQELNNLKNNHSLIVMNLYCQKNVLDRESKVLSGFVEDYLKEINAAINTYDSCTPTNTDENNPVFEDVNYLKNTIGTPILMGLSELIAKKPHDPIHYLAHWLFAYRYNKDVMDIKKRELDELLMERERIHDELKKRQAEIDAYDGVIDLLNKMKSEHLLQSISPEEEPQSISDANTILSDTFPNEVLNLNSNK